MNQIIRASRSIWLTFDQIDVSEKARPYNATDVMALASSIRTLGLQVPITVIERGARYLLIAGRHRLEALRLVGADKVPCRIADLDDLDARLWTISENLHRNELTELQRAEQVEEWRTLAESKGAQVAHSSAFPEAQLSPASFPKGAQVGRPSGGAQPHNAGVSATARNLGVTSLFDLFEGRRQLIIYRAFFEPGVHGWPEHACIGCSLGADQVGHLAHLNARDTTLVYASRAPQADIARLKARMGWEIPWYTIIDSFDADFGVDEWHGHNAFIRDGDRVFRTYFINSRGDEAMGTIWSYLDMTALGRQEAWEDSPEGYPQSRPYKWWNWHESYVPAAAPDPKWVEVSDAGEAAFRKRAAEDPKPV